MQSSSRRFATYFAIFMVVVMGATAILPAFSNNLTTQPIDPVQPTVAPPPTFPPPLPPSSISFDEVYLHPSGIFTIAEPSGWEASEPPAMQEGVRATLSNLDAQSVVQVDLDKPPREDEAAALTLDDVDARFTTSWLEDSWRRYTSWRETGQRRREDDRVIMDFVLTSNNQTYVARQEAWTDGNLIYSVRVVTPENATDMLLHVLDGVAASLTVNEAFVDTPFDWDAYYDSSDQYIIRYPDSWTLADSAPGQPTSISGSSGESLRLETREGAVADEDAARAVVGTLRPGAEILSVQPVTRGEEEGFAVAYSYQTVDGDQQSGLAVLLNGADEQLHVANLRFDGAGVDLNSEEGRASYTHLAEVVDTFAIMPGLTSPEVEVTQEPE